MDGHACQEASVKMDGGMNNFFPGTGTTLCPHCATRFKISEAQLEAPHGMVRCGKCLRVFDARPNFVSDQPDRQLKLPILDEPDDLSPSDIAVLEPMTLAEQVAIVPDDSGSESRSVRRIWPWAISAAVLLLVLLAQIAYFFRADIAVRAPGFKPALVRYCQLLECSVPLPQRTDLINIESSGLEDDPAHEDQIILNALLRNRAPYTQGYPSLELTLNDTQDKAIARRVFRPSDYLAASENEQAGLPPNHEINLKLRLNTANLKPVGYRLMLVSSNN